MRVLYKVTGLPVPKDFVLSDVQADILNNWKPNYNLFSVTQLSERNNKSRGHVQRKIRQLVKLGLVVKHP